MSGINDGVYQTCSHRPPSAESAAMAKIGLIRFVRTISNTLII
ncbi:hypothetical protein [Moraxella haemolytica]|nr:hypothetical protein [Moraxella sp. ZY171148]